MPPKGVKKFNASPVTNADKNPAQTSCTSKRSSLTSVPVIPTSSGVTISIHPIWPDMQFTQGELFFECTLFLYSVLALFLQYLNIYKTLWWLPKSYWHYSLKFHLINPYFLSCVGLLLGWRVTMCFWKTITDLVATISVNQTQNVQNFLMIVEYAIIKTPLMTLIVTSFLFSFTRVIHDFPTINFTWFLYPVSACLFIFDVEINSWFGRLPKLGVQWIKGEIEFSMVCKSMLESVFCQIDLEMVQHMCSENAAQIREEVNVLLSDLRVRIRKSIFAGLSTAYLSVVLPCVFVPHKTNQGMPQTILINTFWEWQLGIVVGLTSFSLYMTYMMPLNYLDLLHRAAIHLGEFRIEDHGKSHEFSRVMNHPLPYNEECLYSDGELVEFNGVWYRGKSHELLKTVAATPNNGTHALFYRALRNPNNVINAMCIFEFFLIFIQFWMLVLTNDWQHIVTFVLLMFANYLLFAKLFKDKIIIGRIYSPSQEDILLVKQLVETNARS